MAETLLNTRDAAKLLGLRPSTLEAWRTKDSSALPFVRITRRIVRYRRVDIDNLIERSLRTSTSDTGRAA